MEFILTQQSGDHRGMSWRIGPKGLLIGRSEECDIVVPELSVSRRHCSLQAQDGGVLMEDLGSRNPPLLNGMAQRMAQLRAGDELRVGGMPFLVGAVQGLNASGVDAAIERESVTVELRGRDLFAQELTSQDTPWPGTLNDYALLFRYARDLSRIGTFRTLEKALCDLASRRFAASGCWLNPPRDMEENPWPWPVSLPALGPEVGAAIEAASRESRAAIVDLGTAVRPVQFLVAPARNGQRCEGIVIAKTSLTDKSSLDEHLVVFAAMADLTGPVLSSVLQNERRRVIQSRREPLSLGDPPILGQSPLMEGFRRRLREVASLPTRVFLSGATGTGKELAARNIHHYSSQASGPFLVVNGAAPPPGFPESAFRDGDATGQLPSAIGGTLFIDNIDRLSEHMQARLAVQLDNLPQASPGRGGKRWIRIVAAALSHDVATHLLPELYHRLFGIHLETLPLAAHPEDIPELALYFLESLQLNHAHITCRFGVDALEALQQRAWPGNVRELRNVVEWLAYRHTAGIIPARAVPPAEGMAVEGFTTPRGKPQPLLNVERAHIEYALEYCGQNVSQAAKFLGISRSTLYHKVKARD